MQNMTNLLKNMTKSLNETEDMFPGLDTSVFDEHNTLQNTKRSRTEQADRVDNQLERLKTLYDHSEKQYQRARQAMTSNDLLISSYAAGSNDIEYSTVAWVQSKYPSAYGIVDGYYFNPQSPAATDLPRYVAALDRTLAHKLNLSAKLKKLKATAGRIRRAAASEDAKQQKASASTSAISEKSIPKIIPVKYFENNGWVTKDLDNPYWSSTSKKATVVLEKYAGHPAHYNWQKREKTSFFLLSKLVKELGLPELSILYFKRLESRWTRVAMYMENADVSFQYFLGDWSVNGVYTKDTKASVYGGIVDNRTITDIKKAIDKTATELKKHGKKP